MNVLALDTSTELGSVAVMGDGELRSEITARVRAKHGETLLPLIEEALRLAKVDKAALGLIAVGLGPGSFTGTRVGVATAKGLAVALGLPMIGVVSLRAMARGAAAPLVLAAADAHKGEVYAALYARVGDTLETRIAPFHAPPEDALAQLGTLAPGAVACGSALRRYPERFADRLGAELLPASFDAPRGALIALEAVERFERDGADDAREMEPLYVRPSDAELPG